MTQIPKSNRWPGSYNFRASLNAAETPVSHTPSSALSPRPRVCVCVRVRVSSGCSSQQRQRHYLNSFSRRCRHLPRRPRSGTKQENCRNSSFCACCWFFFYAFSPNRSFHHVCRDAAVQHKCGKGEGAWLKRHFWLVIVEQLVAPLMRNWSTGRISEGATGKLGRATTVCPFINFIRNDLIFRQHFASERLMKSHCLPSPQYCLETHGGVCLRRKRSEFGNHATRKSAKQTN